MSVSEKEKVLKVVADRFKNGFRVSSSIDYERFKIFYHEEYDEMFEFDAPSLNDILATEALIFDDRAYVYNAVAVAFVKTFLGEIETPQISIDYLYNKYSSELYSLNIFSPDKLKAFVERFLSDYSIYADYIIQQGDISPIDMVKNVFEENDVWSLSELHERLPFLSADTIRRTMRSSDFLRVDTETYVHIDNLDLPETEWQKIAISIERKLSIRDSIYITELDFSLFSNLNPGYAITTLRDAVFNKFLSSLYNRNGYTITRKDEDELSGNIDKTQTDYEPIFERVLDISPELSMFIKHIRAVHPPQDGEWQRLMPQAQGGNKLAKNRMIDMYLRVVVRVALGVYDYKGYELEDLIQEGVIGLMKAIEKYDANEHGTFVSYSLWWIRQFIDRAIADKKRAIRIPVHTLEVIDKINQFYRQFSKQSGRDPTAEEVSIEICLPPEKVEEILKSSQEPKSLDTMSSVLEAKYGDEWEAYFGDAFIDEDVSCPMDTAIYALLNEQMVSVLGTLTVREGDVLKLRYGFDGRHNRTLEEVGIKFGVTRERIRQIEAKALRKLRLPSRSKKLEDFLF